MNQTISEIVHNIHFNNITELFYYICPYITFACIVYIVCALREVHKMNNAEETVSRCCPSACFFLKTREQSSMKLVNGFLHLKFSGKCNFVLYQPRINHSLYDAEIRVIKMACCTKDQCTNK
jgi:hypothetical protein